MSWKDSDANAGSSWRLSPSRIWSACGLDLCGSILGRLRSRGVRQRFRLTPAGSAAVRISRLAVLALLLGAVGVPAALLGGSHDDPPARALSAARRPPPVTLNVRVDSSHPRPPVPSRFLGLSFEVASSSEIAGFADSGDFTALLRSLGPGVLRLGGISADTRSAWVGAHTRKPAWASGVVDAHDLRGLATLARASGW